MIVDTSILVAIITVETGYKKLLATLSESGSISIGTPTVFEAAMLVGSRLNIDGLTAVADLVREFEMKVIPFTEQHVNLAYAAFMRYGKGRHPARLNFGDCVTYAVAKLSGEALMFVGNDFTKTDLMRKISVH
jgi:ribonuclease VapC